MSIIYTSNFNIRWGNYKSTCDWQIYSLYNLQKYSEYYNCEFRVIDNISKFSEVFDRIIKVSNYSADRWAVACLSSIYCVADFLESGHENMIWIDLDVGIGNYINLFNLDGDFCIYKVYPKKNDKYQQKKIRFYSDYYGGQEEDRIELNAGVFKFTKVGALDFINHINKYNMNPLNENHQDSLVEHFSKRDNIGYLCDECIFETYANQLNSQTLNIIQCNELTEQELQNIISNPYSVNFIHFINFHKRKLLDFYRNKDAINEKS